MNLFYRSVLITFIISVIIYVMYSLYGSADQIEKSIPQVNATLEDKQKITLFKQDDSRIDTAVNEPTNELTRCEQASSSLFAVYNNSATFLESHQTIVDQLIFKNTELSQRIRDKVATELGLNFVFLDRDFSQHLRVEKTVDFASEFSATPVDVRDLLKISRDFNQQDYSAVSKHLTNLLRRAPTKRLSVDNKSLLTRTLNMHYGDEALIGIVKTFLNSGYQVSLTEIVNMISMRLNEQLLITLVDAYSGDKSAIYNLKDGTRSTNLLLHSVKHEKLILAEHLLTLGVSFRSNIELQKRLGFTLDILSSKMQVASPQSELTPADEDPAYDLSETPLDTNIKTIDSQNALNNLLEAGVFIFDQSTSQEEHTSHQKLANIFGASSAKRFIMDNSQKDLLSEEEERVAIKTLESFSSRSFALLPAPIQEAILTNCEQSYIKLLFTLLERQHNEKINSLYKRLVKKRPEVNAVLRGVARTDIGPTQINQLSNMTSYAAKAALENIIKRQARLRRSEERRNLRKNRNTENETFLNNLANEVIDKGLEASLTKIENTEILSPADKNAISLQLAFYFGNDLNMMDKILSSGVVADYFFIETVFREDDADMLSLLIKNGMPIDRVDYDKRNMLFRASSKNAKQIFDLLLASNIELKPASNIGYDALDIALVNTGKSGDFYFVDKLMQAGYDISPSHIELLRDLADKHFQKISEIISQYDIEIVDD